MKTKVINTRKYFLDMKSLIQNSVTISAASVDYREAAYLFCKKVEDVIVNTSQEIFKIDDEVNQKLQEMNFKIYEAGKPFAEVAPKNDEPYKIAVDKLGEWKIVEERIKSKYAEYTEKKAKTDEEYNQWINKKIQLNIEKISSKDIPSFSINGNESQYTYEQIRNLFAEDTVEIEEDDGKEVE